MKSRPSRSDTTPTAPSLGRPSEDGEMDSGRAVGRVAWRCRARSAELSRPSELAHRHHQAHDLGAHPPRDSPIVHFGTDEQRRRYVPCSPAGRCSAVSAHGAECWLRCGRRTDDSGPSRRLLRPERHQAVHHARQRRGLVCRGDKPAEGRRASAVHRHKRRRTSRRRRSASATSRRSPPWPAFAPARRKMPAGARLIRQSHSRGRRGP